jgi:hypothetical protein
MAAKLRAEDPTERARRSAAARAQWSDPKIRARMVKGLKIAHAGYLRVTARLI